MDNTGFIIYSIIVYIISLYYKDHLNGPPYHSDIITGAPIFIQSRIFTPIKLEFEFLFQEPQDDYY